jgi:NADPH:quinone reductase-like Zn-dependent oxidoreductase/SAM-dependent methyltransferase/acyl carrier protein
MAIESSMQMAGKETSIRGILVSRVNFKALLPIPDHAEGVEVSLSYAPADDGSGMRRFRINSYNEEQEQWTEHCSGYISVEYAEFEGELEIDGEANTEWLDSLRDSERQLTESVERRKVFEQLESSGLHLGPLFQHLSNMKTSGNRNGHGLATVEVPDIRSIMPEHYMHPHMLHPVTLQNMLSSVTVALSDLSNTQPEGGVFFPKYIDNVWISSGGSYKPHTQFRCFSTATAAGINLRHCQIHILAEPSLSEVAVSLSGIQLARHISDEDFSKTPSIPRFYSTEWQPDIHLVTNEFFDSLVNHQEDTDNKWGSECEHFTDLQLAATLISTDALFDLKGLDLTGLEPHYHRFYDLLKHIAADILTNAIPRVPFKLWKKYAEDEHLKEDLYKRVQSLNSDGALLIKVGTRIPAFFRQELDPLHIMFGQDDLMTEYYDDDFKIGTIQEKLSHYLSLFRWNKSNLSVLEVGAGTGSFTSQVLTHLSPQDADRSISEYVFTDLSPGFFEKAKQRLRPWSDIMTYKKLDVGNDPLAQGFELAAFDLIIASNVLHATPNLFDTLQNIHSLLKPGGKLVFHEGVRQDALWTNISFSPLSGWWLSTEPERRWCPYIPTEIWNDYLHTAGFSGIDLEFASSDYAEFSKISLMVSTALSQSSRPVPDRVEAILILPDSKEPTIVKELRRQMGQLGISLSLHTLSEVSTLDISEKPCLALLGTDMPILSHDNFTAVDELKELLLRCRNLIWISGDSTKEPFFDIATGLIRSMRHAEGKDDRNFVTVSVSDTEPIDKSLSEAISKIFRHQFLSPGLCETKNAEYRIEKGSILTSRVSPNQDATLTIRSGLSLPQAVPTPWNDVHRPQKLVNRQSRGSNLELVWVSDDVQSERLGDNEVDINVKAVSLRWRDSLASSGELPQEGLGGEASGIITRVGSAVRGLHKGDRVMCFGDRRQGREGALRSVLRVNALLVTPIPDDLSLEAAAALLADWTVAIYSLRYIGKLVSRDKILIQAATGSIGQAAIRYAQSVDANIFAAVSNTGEKEYLMREYGLLEDHIFYTPSPFMSNQIKRKVPEGVDIVLLPSSHHSFMRKIGYVAPFGKILEVSTGNVESGVSLPSINHPSSVIFARVDVHSFAKHRPSMVQEVLGDIKHLLSLPHALPEQPAKVLTYSQLHEGLQKLRGGNIDNVILQPADDIVPVVPEVSRPSMLDETASYIIIGTLNSLSLKMSMRLAERGAKNLIFLSTSSSFQADVGETERMLGSLRTQGCAVHLRSCDFFNETELHHAMTELKQQLPPVKGVIYRPHETQPIKSTESPSNHYQKFRELWLVHQMFPAVDYLVMVSPMKGLDGLCTESETHPTRTFQDTLVHHRVSLGLHSASVDLGDMNDDDALAVIDYATSSRDHASFPSSQIISQFPGPFSSDRQQSVPTYLSDPLFHQLPVSQPRDKSTDSPTERKLSVADLLQSSHDSEHAGEIVSREIRRKLSNLLNVSEDEISSEHNIRDNGVDSLIEMEFRNWIDKELKINLPSEDLISKSISKLSAQVVSASPLVQCT